MNLYTEGELREVLGLARAYFTLALQNESRRTELLRQEMDLVNKSAQHVEQTALNQRRLQGLQESRG